MSATTEYSAKSTSLWRSCVLNSKTKRRLLMALVMFLGISGLIAGPLTTTASAAPPVVQLQTFGSSYGELSARWWQWAFSIPASINPQLDTTGANCGQGQVDDVWFLAANFGGTSVRSCTIPAGKPIFFPVINSATFKPFGFETLLDLRRQNADFIDAVSELSCTIDGSAVPNLAKFRVRSPSFTVIAPPKGLVAPGQLSLPANTDSIVSDGYWLLLSPLALGQHEIKFHASTTGGFQLDVTYTLTIAP
jgi:hypothetical protein